MNQAILEAINLINTASAQRFGKEPFLKDAKGRFMLYEEDIFTLGVYFATIDRSAPIVAFLGRMYYDYKNQNSFNAYVMGGERFFRYFEA